MTRKTVLNDCSTGKTRCVCQFHFDMHHFSHTKSVTNERINRLFLHLSRLRIGSINHVWGIDVCVIFFLRSEFLFSFRTERRDVCQEHATVKRTRVRCADKFIFWPFISRGKIDKVQVQVPVSTPLCFTDIECVDICFYMRPYYMYVPWETSYTFWRPSVSKVTELSC